MVYTVPLIIFMDDVSGNVLKQWNKHFVIYMSNVSLQCEMLDHEFCVQFVTSSPHASPMELMYAMKQSILKASTSGIITWDCQDQEEVMLVPYGLFLGGDNPMQAKECSQGSLNCNYYCQTYQAGGPKGFKESEAGYCSLFKVEQAHIQLKQFKTVVLPGTSMKIQASVSSTGVCDSLSQGILNMVVEMGKVLQESKIKAMLEKELTELLGGKGLNNIINPLLGMENPAHHFTWHSKYFWGKTIHLMEKAKLLDLFQSCLDSIEHDVLNAPDLNLDYICHYKGALIRKHFKSLAQVMPFVIHDLVPQTVIDGWTTIRELVVLLWHTKIKDLEAYLV
ncbi:hypothetical protein EDD16DRAFT_1696648 [Pisolithus croceorrhizus]|nr:hypothetical protein EDD16DRAFT_1696648 [Pisolithus croceorrhizus]KAI6162817.1 hypothetical protein EDD17DRAFT_1776408 [Pisolithus thermaeus]